MLNSGYKKETLANLKYANEKYQEKYNSTIGSIKNLHDSRMSSLSLIKNIEIYINSIANRPKEFEKISATININYKSFENEINILELESKKVEKVSGSVAGAGVAAGVGVAAFGPTAAMAVATTFGTASTGTAISALSGAVATNASLAWLGGGALAAGGGGMSAGSAFLAMAGPVGWVIGGTAIAGGGLLANSKNKKIAKEAEDNTLKIKEETKKISQVEIKVKTITKETIEIEELLKPLLKKMIDCGIKDYMDFNDTQLDYMKKLLNITLALSKKLCEKVN